MRLEIWDETGTILLRVTEGTPVCGVDFCDECGDCLACYGDMPCRDGGEHHWVQYGEAAE